MVKKERKISKMRERRLLKKAVDDVLGKLTDEFIRNPMRFFSEADIHWYFCHLLLREKSFDKLIPTKFKNNSENYKTILLHQEYGLRTKKGKRIDIAILDAEGVNTINEYNLKCNKNYVKPFIGIEFLTEKNYGGKKAWDDPWNKIGNVHKKLKNNEIEYPYLVFYYRKIEKRKQSINNVDQIKNKIKELYERNRKGKVKIIGVIRDIYGNGCEKFENGNWNKGKLRKKVL